MDSFFLVSNTEPMTLAIMVICGSLAFFFMSCIAWHDCRTFEIDYILLLIATLLVLPVIVVAEGVSALSGALVTAMICGGVTWLGQKFRPGKIGMGDIPLMGFIGLVAGPDNTFLVLVALVVFSALTSAAYSIRRGKRLFKSMFPMALPGMLAATLALGLRFIEPVDWRFVQIDIISEFGHILIPALIAMVIIIFLKARIISALKKAIHHRKP